MDKPNLVIFASGKPKVDESGGGGSGAKNLVLAQRAGILSANIVAFVSNNASGGVQKHAQELGIPFVYFPGPYDFGNYRYVVRSCQADFIALSGWLKLVEGLDPRTTFNIHNGPLPEFGGLGMYGHHVHEEVLKAFHEGRLTHSAVCMHFVTTEYDKGPVFFYHKVPILAADTAEELGRRVNDIEHKWQPWATNLVVSGRIFWDGKSLRVPPGYSFLPKP
ncbi:MAG: formyltransferase family protein [Candidatus Staskawiczbacteria bacterium]